MGFEGTKILLDTACIITGITLVNFIVFTLAALSYELKPEHIEDSHYKWILNQLLA